MKSLKSKYSDLLKNPLWAKKRKEILKRDGYKCRKCPETIRLHVHHKRYIIGKNPWEIQNRYLITLCFSCHQKEHENRHISSFFRRELPKKQPTKKKSSRRRKKTTLNVMVPIEISPIDKYFQNKEKLK